MNERYRNIWRYHEASLQVSYIAHASSVRTSNIVPILGRPWGLGLARCSILVVHISAPGTAVSTAAAVLCGLLAAQVIRGPDSDAANTAKSRLHSQPSTCRTTHGQAVWTQQRPVPCGLGRRQSRRASTGSSGSGDLEVDRTTYTA